MPHAALLALWGLAAICAGVANWVVATVTGRPTDVLHHFLGCFLRSFTRVSAYGHLLADPFPSFSLLQGYAVDLETPPPERQPRLAIAFRPLLALPALVLASVFGFLLELVALAAWLVCLLLGRIPLGMQDLGLYCLRYAAETGAYVFLVSGRYPSLSWARAEPAPTSAA